jgi:hypothetical protein
LKQNLDEILLDFLMCGAPAHEQGLQLRAFTGYLLVSYNQLDYLMNAITARKNLDGCSARSVVSAPAFPKSINCQSGGTVDETDAESDRPEPAGPLPGGSHESH